MIDVQAALKSSGRCYVPPEAGVLGVIPDRGPIARTDPCAKHVWRHTGRALVDPDHLTLRPFWAGVDQPSQSYFVSTNGLILFLWNSSSEYRSDGREKRDHSGEVMLGESHDVDWRDNLWYRLECVAWLLTFEDFKRGEWYRLSGAVRVS